jgi:hypothetical protein
MSTCKRSGCVSVHSLILANNQLDALFMSAFIYFVSLHVSSVTVLIIRRSNCVKTSSGIICDCLVCRSERNFPPDWHTKQSLTQTNHTRYINTIRSPDDEHCDAQNMYRYYINKYKKCVKLVVSKNL